MEVGQKVKWTSHGGKTKTEKKGVIIAIVPAGVRRAPIARGLRDTYLGIKGLSDLMKEDVVRDHESCIVYATDERGNNRIYHPAVSNLEFFPVVIHHTSTGPEWTTTNTLSAPAKTGFFARMKKLLFG